MTTTPPTPAADVTDEQIDAVFMEWNSHCFGGPVEAHRRFARAVIALHPAPVAATGKADERDALTGEQVCAEFDALSIRVSGWNTLSSVNAAWHAFKCGVRFAERKSRPSLSTPETTPPTQPKGDSTNE